MTQTNLLSALPFSRAVVTALALYKPDLHAPQILHIHQDPSYSAETARFGAVSGVD